MTDYARLVSEHWRERLGWEALSPVQQETVGEFGLHMFGLASPTVADIDEIKYEGRLVILDDGSRWEVDSLDIGTVDFWTSLTKVAVIDGVMYNLEDAEKAEVTPE